MRSAQHTAQQINKHMHVRVEIAHIFHSIVERRMKALIFSHCSLSIEWLVLFSDPAKKILILFSIAPALPLFLCYACVQFCLFFHYFCFSFGFSRLFLLVFSKMKKCETCTWFATITCLSVWAKMISERTHFMLVYSMNISFSISLLFCTRKTGKVYFRFFFLYGLFFFLRSTHELLCEKRREQKIWKWNKFWVWKRKLFQEGIYQCVCALFIRRMIFKSPNGKGKKENLWGRIAYFKHMYCVHVLYHCSW